MAGWDADAWDAAARKQIAEEWAKSFGPATAVPKAIVREVRALRLGKFQLRLPLEDE